jgi:hypothetical protein
MATVSAKIYEHHEKADGTFNVKYALYKGMKGLRDLTGLPEFTLYWARHTFGTLARNECRKSVDDIGEALNHVDNGHATTDIYIAKNWAIVDDVQNEVVALLGNNGKGLDNSPLINPDLNRKTMSLVVA